MNVEQKLAQAEEMAWRMEREDLPLSAEIVRGLIRLVRELAAENEALKREVKA